VGILGLSPVYLILAMIAYAVIKSLRSERAIRGKLS
jgi:hypothetical protein